MPMPDASQDTSFATPRSETEFLKEMREEYTADVAADRENCEGAAKDLRAMAGEPWDEEVLALRKGRPSLTINRNPQFVRQVTGDIRLNKPAIKVSPVEDADQDDAEVIEGLVRHIEYRSKAARVYATTADAQVACGMGHMRLTVEWPEDGFEPELMIRGIRNPFSVKWDSGRQRPDCSDATRCFVETSVPRKRFEMLYPDAIAGSWLTSSPQGLSDWINRDRVRLVEYWKVIKRPVTLYLLANGTVIDDSDGDSLRIAAEQVGIIRERKSTKSQVVQYLTNGQSLLQEPYVWPGSRIPIITAWGEEVVLGERTVRHGLIRHAQDASYLSNYLWSAAVEAIALQPKPKWVASAKQVQGREGEWANANLSMESTLVYNEDGSGPPQFQRPPDFPAAFMNMARAAEDAMKATTGIYDAALGQASNETSGRAIMARDRQGDVSTYVYPDNLVAAIENLAGQIVEMIPTVYDAPRQVRILGEDMRPAVIKVNQDRGLGADGQPLKTVDLTTGKYDVIVQTGPGFTTRRQEGAEAMLEFARIFPPAAPMLMDLVAKNQDWPDRDEFIQRIAALQPKANNQAPPAPNPKDVANAEKLAAETTGQKLKNISDAMALGLDPAMLQPGGQQAAQQSPAQGEPPVPSIGQMNGPMGPSSAPGVSPGQSVQPA